MSTQHRLERLVLAALPLLPLSCSWSLIDRPELDGVFRRDCSTHDQPAMIDAVFAGISAAAAVGLLIAGGTALSADDAKEGDGAVVGIALMSMSSIPIVTGSLWGPSADYGFTQTRRCAELRELYPTCRSEPRCAAEGLCTFQSPICVAATDADCLESEACKREGRCHPSGGVCVKGGEGTKTVPTEPARP